MALGHTRSKVLISRNTDLFVPINFINSGPYLTHSVLVSWQRLCNYVYKDTVCGQKYFLRIKRYLVRRRRVFGRMSKLLEACIEGDLATVEERVSEGDDVNDNQGGPIPLNEAAFYGHDRIVRYLLEHGADLDKRGLYSGSALHWACRNGHFDVVKTLLSKGADIEAEDEDGWTPLIRAAMNGHSSVVKTLILTGSSSLVHHKDRGGRTALYHAACNDHVQCGILLVEAGANVKLTPFEKCSESFREAILQADAFRSRKTICVIGDACSGKSTLIASLQNENVWLGKRISNWIFGVDDVRKRTIGIDPVFFTSKIYGDVVVFDFAGQQECHGPHEMFINSIMKNTRSTVTIILVVKVVEEKSVIFQQLYRWLSPLSDNSVGVIVVGSFFDKVKSESEAKDKLVSCCQAVVSLIVESEADAAMKFLGVCFLDCRQPYSNGISQLVKYFKDVPAPQCKAVDTSYSICWVVSCINCDLLDKKAIKLIDFMRWIDKSKDSLHSNLPSGEVVCSDLSATGNFLYLPNAEDPAKSWLILDLSSILQDVYGTIFTSSNLIVNKLGLFDCQMIPKLFPTLDSELIRNVLISLEFCIEVDPVLMKKLAELMGRNGDKFLFFPILLSAEPPKVFEAQQSGVVSLCWQLQVCNKHFISNRLLQIIILHLAAQYVFHSQLSPDTVLHYCSIWYNGILWQSLDGVDVAVQISKNSIIRVIGRSKAGPNVLCQYISEIAHLIMNKIRQLYPRLSAISYIVETTDLTGFLQNHYPSVLYPHKIFPVKNILKTMEGGKRFCFSLPDEHGNSEVTKLDSLFSTEPTKDIIKRLNFVNGELPCIFLLYVHIFVCIFRFVYFQ